MKFSQILKLKKILPFLNKKMKIIDLGCGDMWLTNYLKNEGYDIVGLSLKHPADIIGDVKTYKFKKNFYDAVLAIEMVEHVDCFKEIEYMLKPGGILIITTPTPHLDWFCFLMEKLGLFQSRGETPHKYLVYLKDIPFFKPILTKSYVLVQFGVFRKIYDSKRSKPLT